MGQTLICPRERVRRLLDRLPPRLPGPPAAVSGRAKTLIPFPVSAPFEVRPDLKKLGDDPLFVTDSDWHDWVHRKQQAFLQGEAELLFSPDLTQEGLNDLAKLLREALSAEAELLRPKGEPGPLSEEGGFPWLGLGSLPDPMEFLLGLTLTVQEDFALMTPDHHGMLRASVLSVCFPSGWDPKEKIGQSLIDIHMPVADNAEIQKSAHAMSQAMLHKGPFVRHVWTLSGNDRLSRAPGEDTFQQPASLDEIWFRCERQTTVPLKGRASLFLIRVLVAPLTQVLETQERREALTASIQSMSPQMLRYKGLDKIAHLFKR